MYSEDLARITAEAAFIAPFRQVKPMTSYEFRKWLSDRGVGIHDWQTLHFLWRQGVYIPVAVSQAAIEQTPGIAASGRFIPTVIHQGEELYGDLGLASVEVPALEWGHGDIKDLSRSLWWHPFQLFQFCQFEATAKMNWSLDTFLGNVSEKYLEWEREHRLHVRKVLADDAVGNQSQEFRRILALLLLAEPMVHGVIHGSIRYESGESIEQYYEWRERTMAEDLLQKVGLTKDQAIKWHEELSIQACLNDPLSGIRTLVNQVVPRNMDRTKGQVLRTKNAIDQAESLRRYLEWKYETDLPEEDDYESRQEWVKRENYGTKRLLDGNRTARRRIVREFGLDHEDRVVLYLEGPTETAFVKAVADAWGVNLESRGIQLFNLEGKDKIGKSRVLHQQLESLQGREVFAYAALDEDGGGEHLRVLKGLARDGLLSAGFSVWKPDFEEQNFSLEELASTASKLAKDSGQEFTLTADEIRQRMNEKQVPVGKAIEQLTSAQKAFTTKGNSWGAALAAMVTADNAEVPEIIKDEQGDRPILTVLKMLIRGTTADFALSLEHTKEKYSKGT